VNIASNLGRNLNCNW